MLDAEEVRTFVNGTVHFFETATGHAATVGSPYLCIDKAAVVQDYTGVIGISGNREGKVYFTAPRGMLSHWIKIKDGVIDNYQAVVPSTWNGSPRDRDGQRGAYESSLIGTPIAVEDQPLEILRTIHSFDPCMACAAHVLDADGNEVVEVKVL